MKTIKLEDIESDDNRKHTKDEGFEQLVSSIREHGLIEPPVVRGTGGGKYKAVAGRRRIAALRRLEAEAEGEAFEVECVELEPGGGASDEAIALAENVNRQEMHPLDEAELFGRMAGRGMAIEDVARHYARSPSAIYARLRLAGLSEGLKGMFRDGALSIGSAAVLAELPEEDQADFFSAYEGWGGEIGRERIMAFVQKKQRFAVEGMEGCAGCARRTHNQGNDLFEEFQYLNDVCLEPDCYRRQWKGMIEAALAEAGAGAPGSENKIHFAGGTPELLYGRASHAEFSAGGSAERFEILKGRDYKFTGATKRKNGACWLIGERHGAITLRREGYEKRPPQEKGAGGAAAGGKGGRRISDIDRYGRGPVEAAAAGLGQAAADLVKKLEGRNISPSDFENKIQGMMMERAVAGRVEAEKNGAEPRDYLSMFLRAADEEMYVKSGSLVDFDKDQKRMLRSLTGKESAAELNVPFWVQMLFHVLLTSLDEFRFRSMPGFDELESFDASKYLFLEYAGLTVDEYRGLYLRTAVDAAAEILKPKSKLKKNKKQGAEGAEA